jgi:hypothetical protein
MKSVIEYSLSLTGICINKCDVTSAKEGMMTRSQKKGLIRKVYFVNETVLQWDVRGLLEKYPTFGREKETGLLGALDT